MADVDKNTFQRLEQSLGVALLNYILNKTPIISEENYYEDHEFLPPQIEVVSDLVKRIVGIKVKNASQLNFNGSLALSFSRERIENENLFNHYRRKCGGMFPEIEGKDRLVDILHQISVEYYPYLLLNSSEERWSPIKHTPSLFYPNSELIKDIVKDDKIAKLTKNGEGEYFYFKTENGLQYSNHTSIVLEDLIKRAFQNACSRNSYGMQDFLAEISLNVDVLRRLSDGLDVEFYTFTGVLGLIFDDFDSIEFENSRLIRFKERFNPSIHTNRLASTFGDGQNTYYTGSVLETKHVTRLSDSPPNANTNSTIEVSRAQHQAFHNLRLAITFFYMKDRGISATFFENGFPLVGVGNFGHGGNLSPSNLHVKKDDISGIKEWFNFLSGVDVSKLEVPIKRMTYAIFERKRAEDAIVDCFIAWEGMFSGDTETTFQVAASISKYLQPSDVVQRRTLFKRVKKLYGLRSALVHGQTSNLLKKDEDFENIRSEVIQIGLSCLKKLLHDEVLISLDARGRAQAVLVLN